MYSTSTGRISASEVAAGGRIDPNERSHAIAAALASVANLNERTPERESLWLALWKRITTQETVVVRPTNSGGQARVSREFASLEVIAAWTWLEKHETEARTMHPVVLERTLRNHVTRSHNGSGRAAMADNLCGITNVPRNIRVSLHDVDVLEDRAS